MKRFIILLCLSLISATGVQAHSKQPVQPSSIWGNEAVNFLVGHPENVNLERVDSLMHAAIHHRAFPGAAIAVGHGAQIVKLQGYGHFTYRRKVHPVTPKTRFDLASMTKVIATTTAAMLLYQQGRLSLDTPVAHYLPSFAQHGKGKITIRQLLTHSSGLKPYLTPKGIGLHTHKQIIDSIMAQKLAYKPGSKSVYSGLNMITLMRVIETITGQNFATYCQQHIFKPLDMNDTGFRPGIEKDTTDVAPTADYAGDRFHGIVNDPLARELGGISGNAGLFSTASDLAKFATMMIQNGRFHGKQFLKPSTIKLFRTRANVPNSTRALGWDTKTKHGYSSAGHLFGPHSFGHTGYTGTSIWFDPDHKLFAILLTNQVYPDGHKTKIYKVRAKYGDLVYSAIIGGSR